MTTPPPSAPPPPPPGRKNLGLKVLLLVTLAAFAALHLLPAPWIEALYCESIYPLVFRVQQAVFGSLPISVSEVALVLVTCAGLLVFTRGLSRIMGQKCTLSAAIGAGVSRLLTWSCLAYLAFLALWGFHHGRLPYAVHLGLDKYPPSQELDTQMAELESLCRSLVEGCNKLQPLVRPEGLRMQDKAIAIHAMARLSKTTPIFHGMEPSFRVADLSPMLSRLGISGIYSPFTGDAHLNGEQPMWARPFIACHEMAHQLGIAREGEASFVAWQASMGSASNELRYSAYMVALGPATQALFWLGGGQDDSVVFEILDELHPDVQGERERAAIWWAEEMGFAGDLAQATNHAYLRSQGQAAGVASYGFLVDLMLAEQRRSAADLEDGKEPTE